MRYFLILLIGLLGPQLCAQESVRTHVSFEMGAHFPGGDLADRFGFSLSLGGQFEAMLTQSLWHAGVKGIFLFGTRVKEDVLSNLRTAQGDIVGNDRALAEVSLGMRGYFVGGYVGKTISFNEKNPQSGLKVSLGGGLLQHKIRIQDNTQSVNQITEEYMAGYDRRTNGPAIYGYVGYQNIDLNKRLNFHIGIDYLLGFTENKRSYNFNEMRRDDKKRIDGMFGIRVGWILPITHGEKADTIFY